MWMVNGPALGGVVARAGGGGAVGGGALFVTTSSGRALFGGEGLDCVLGSNATAAIDTIDDCGALGGRGGGGGSEQVKREEKDQKMHCNGQMQAKRWVGSLCCVVLCVLVPCSNLSGIPGLLCRLSPSQPNQPDGCFLK